MRVDNMNQESVVEKENIIGNQTKSKQQHQTFFLPSVSRAEEPAMRRSYSDVWQTS